MDEPGENRPYGGRENHAPVCVSRDVGELLIKCRKTGRSLKQ